jgi:hypothetical protein
MACRTAANLFVGGVGTVAASIAGNDVYHALDLVKNGFEAPEASARENGLVERLSFHRIILLLLVKKIENRES